MVATGLMTIEELEQLPDDGYRYTLIRGVLYRMPPPKPCHGRITTTVAGYLRSFVAEHRLGIVSSNSGFVLARDPDVLLGPDVAFVRADRLPPDEDRYPDLAPDLAVEILSPSNTGPDVEDKIREYLAAGVPLIWLVDPRRRTVRVRAADGTDHLLTEADELDGGDVLPGFRLPVARLFE